MELTGTWRSFKRNDIFQLPFDEIAPKVDRSPAAAGQPGRGAAAVARQTRPVPNSELVPATVNSAPGVVVTVGGRPIVVVSFIVARGRILEIAAVTALQWPRV